MSPTNYSLEIFHQYPLDTYYYNDVDLNIRTNIPDKQQTYSISKYVLLCLVKVEFMQ